MPSPSQANPGPAQPHPAVEHLSGAHERLKTLREKIGEHPELTEAMRSLEMALSILTVKTGGMF
jgi:hypothetical protein